MGHSCSECRAVLVGGPASLEVLAGEGWTVEPEVLCPECKDDVTVFSDGTVVLRNVVTVLDGRAVRLELDGEQMRMLHSKVVRWWGDTE